jgi:arsenate reductase (thioredoxin)
MAVKVLFISSLDSARGQMAEGLMRELGGAAVDVSSAGSAASAVDPRAVLVMAERGIDISGQLSQSLEEYIGSASFDHLITVCERHERTCPAFPGRATRLYWPFEDPARADGDDADRMAAFRDVRDRLELLVRGWLETHRRELHPEARRRVRAAR